MDISPMKKDEVYNSFEAYIDLATKKFKEDENGGMKAVLSIIEDSDEFNSLASNMSVSLGYAIPGPNQYSIAVSRMGGFARVFHRRSGLYKALSKKEQIDLDEYFKRLWDALQEKEITTTSLTLIGLVDFGKDVVNFDEFEIRKFSEEELDELFESDLSEEFYPDTKLNTSTLSNYWFMVEETIRTEKSMDFDFIQALTGSSFQEHLERRSRVSLEIPERNLQLLALYNWEDFYDNNFGDENREWTGFSRLNRLVATDDILQQPLRTSNMTYPKETDISSIFLGSDDTQRLEDVVNKASAFFQQIDLNECHWGFIERALGYLEKAFFADELEQLLWHMVVLEALFGERPETTESIARRVSTVLGKTEDNRGDIKKKFKDLYDFRCDLVHGNEFKNQLMKGHLKEARSLSRKSVVWFLTYLSNKHAKLKLSCIEPSDYPGRSKLLAQLDHTTPMSSEECQPLEESLPSDLFKAEVQKWAKRIKVELPEFYINPMRDKWGSCSTNGSITFASDLLNWSENFRAKVIVEQLLCLKLPTSRDEYLDKYLGETKP